MSDKLIIFDTTLRDGEQSPGASMTLAQKLAIAQALADLKVDVIEAGFPVASPGDFEAVKAVASQIKGPVICGLARAIPGDIEQAAQALSNAERCRIHTFIATSDIHMQHKLRLTPEAVLQQAVSGVMQARQYTEDVEFSAEDAGRSSDDFLARIVEAVIEAGATTVNLPDTVGYCMPEEYAEKIQKLITRVPNAHRAVFSVHCHNDLGLAVANSLAAVKAGARQVECTINGLGERAGNAALEEIVMAVKMRPEVFHCHTDIETSRLVECSQLVSQTVQFPIQPNKAIVGENAFAHESGIHQDGVLKKRETYEIMQAESVGWTANRLVLGKHSGRSAFAAKVRGITKSSLPKVTMNALFEDFKQLADAKHEITDEDIATLLAERGIK